MMRFPIKMFKKIKKESINNRIKTIPMENKNGIYSYPQNLEKKLSKFLFKIFKKYLDGIPIYNCSI